MNRLIDKVNKELRKYIENNILVQYIHFESSHNDEHINIVINNSFDIVKDLKMLVPLKEVKKIFVN